MKWHKQAVRAGALAILTATLLRFACSGIFGSAVGIFAQPELASFLIYSETGRKPVLPDNSTLTNPNTSTGPEQTEPQQTQPQPTEPQPTQPTPTQPPDTRPVSPVFVSTDTQYFGIEYSCSYRPDTKSLLLQKLNWDLTGDKPSVLIIHTHGTEAYTRTSDTYYQGHAAYRTTDDRYNVISLGDELTRLLEEEGITVIHDRTAFDYLDYDNAYANSRAAVQEHLKQNPSIKLVLDLHRDAMQNADGTQYATSATVDGKASAQLMFVVGTDAQGESHPNWKTNLSIAEKLTVLMEKDTDGICRPIKLRGKRYNHDLAMGALIVEVGTAGNTHTEAMNAIPALAEAIVVLAKGSK